MTICLAHTQRTIVYRPVVTVTVTINADGILAAMVRFFYLAGLGRLRVWLRWQAIWLGAAGKLALRHCCIVATQQYNAIKSAFLVIPFPLGTG
jgi:hypothetical protein